MPWKIYRDGERWCVHKLNADDTKGERVACHDSEEAAMQQMAALHANVKEFQGEFSDVMVVTELRGSYPTVPIAGDIDYDALIAGDASPMFLTIPIGKVGVTSGNQRHYDDAFVIELERQTLQSKPIGLMGHLPAADRATAFPPEAVHWVGAARQGDTLWGKAYVVPGPVRERIARYKAQGKAIATSIDAFAEGVWDETLKAYRMSAQSLRLNQIDIAPADRAGIPDLAAVPLLTSEMQPAVPPEPEQLEEPVMDKLQVINEMTADDARLLPESVRAAILASVSTPPEVAQVQSLRETLGLDEGADVVSAIAEMRRVQDEQRQADVQRRITELAAGPETGIKVEPVRALVVELVNARHPQTVQEAEAAYSQVVDTEAVKAALKLHVVETMGPRQGAGPVQGQKTARKFFVIPEEA